MSKQAIREARARVAETIGPNADSFTFDEKNVRLTALLDAYDVEDAAERAREREDIRCPSCGRFCPSCVGMGKVGP